MLNRVSRSRIVFCSRCGARGALTSYCEQLKQCQQQLSPSTYCLAWPSSHSALHTDGGGRGDSHLNWISAGPAHENPNRIRYGCRIIRSCVTSRRVQIMRGDHSNVGSRGGRATETGLSRVAARTTPGSNVARDDPSGEAARHRDMTRGQKRVTGSAIAYLKKKNNN